MELLEELDVSIIIKTKDPRGAGSKIQGLKKLIKVFYLGWILTGMGSWNSQLLFGIIINTKKIFKNQSCLTPFFLNETLHQ